MAAPWQTIQIPFRGGIDQKTVAELVDPGTRLLDVLNGLFAHDGAIEKRPGLQALGVAQLSGDPTMGTPQRILPASPEMATIDGDKLFAYAPSAQVWSYRGLASPAVASRVTLEGPSVRPAGIATAYGGGYFIVCYKDLSGEPAAPSGKVWISFYDQATSAPVKVGWQLTGTGFYCNQLVVSGGYAFVFYANTIGEIYGIAINLATLAAGNPTVIVNDAMPTSAFTFGYAFDAVAEVGGSGIILTYGQAQASNTYSNPRVLRLENLPAFTITSSVTLATYASGAATFAPTAAYDANRGIVWFVWGKSTSTSMLLYYVAYSLPAWSQLFAPVSFSPPGYSSTNGIAGPFLACIEDASHAYIVAGMQGGAPSPFASVIAQSNGSYSAGSYFMSGTPLGKAFMLTAGGIARCYVPWELQQFSQPDFYTVLLADTRGNEGQSLLSPRAVAVSGPRQVSPTAANAILDGRFPNVAVGVVAADFVVPMLPSEEFQNQTTNNGVTQYVVGVLNRVTVDFTGTVAWQSATSDFQGYASGGVPKFYDGNVFAELGFLQWPGQDGGGGGFTVAQSGSSSPFTAGAVYGYQLCYAQRDSNNQIHRSPFGTINVTIQAGGASSIIFTIPTLAWTERFGGVDAPIVEVWRTQANGTAYYFVGSVACVSSPQTKLTFTDTSTDSSIATNALVPTTGGVLDSVNPPSLRCMVRHVDRLWGLDDTGLNIWFTTPFNASDAPQWNEALTLSFTQEPGTALGSLDDKIVLFSANHIWFVEGTGPANTGLGSDLTVAVLIPSDVGAADWRSVVEFPGGLLFQAPSGGIYLLDRGLSVSYIGKDVQDITAAATVVSAALVPSSNHVRFILSAGYVLTFDYVLGRWGRLQYTQSVFGAPTSGAMVGTVWTAACSSGVVAQEKSVSGLPAHCYQDSTAAGAHSFVPTSVTLADLKFGGVDGWAQFGEVQGRADWLDPADINMTLTFDYGAASQGPSLFTYGTLHGAQPAQARWRLWPQNMNTTGSAIRAVLSDAAPTGGTVTTGQGVRWLGLAFDVCPIGDRNLNLAAAQKQ